MTNKFMWFSFIVIIVASAGCDRGGSKSKPIATPKTLAQKNVGKTHSTPPTTLPVSNKIRQMKIGSKATYDITSTTKVSGQVIRSFTGTMIQTAVVGSVAPTSGGRAIDLFSELDLHFDTGRSAAFTATEFAEQLPNGTWYFYGGKGDDTARYEITSTESSAKPIYYKSPIVVGDSYSHKSHFSDGSSQQWNVKVISIESVGGKMTYKINRTVYSSREGKTTSCDEWLLPNTVFPVKMYQIVDYGKGEQTITTAVLKAKNL